MNAKKTIKKRQRYGDDDEDYNDHDAYVDDEDYRLREEMKRENTRNKGMKGKKTNLKSIPSSQSLSKGAIRNSGEYDPSRPVFFDFSTALSLKHDHMLRPIWITPSAEDNKIYLEAFHPLYQEAYDRLVAVAEPVSRPKFIHTYQLTGNSLYAAVALGISTDSIIKASLFSSDALYSADNSESTGSQSTM
jgi:DNA excision repair protein ERCC-3